MKTQFSLALLPLTVACGGGLSDDELEDVFGSLSLVMTDAQTQVMAAPTPTELTFEGDAGSWTVSGDITGATWDGTIHVDGSAESATGDYSYDLALGFDAVSAQDITMDGDMSWSLDLSYADAGSYSVAYDMSGELDVTGGAKGHAEIDYSVEVSMSNGQISYDYSGTINGKDVADFAGSGVAAY